MAILRPSSDLVAGGWTSSPSGTLASCIDETTASDTDYIETTGTGNSSIILLGSGSDPGNDNNHKLSYRASSTSETLNVDVVQMVPSIVTSKQPWRRQPQYPVEIDWSNPLTRGLISAFLPNELYPYDIVRNTFLSGGGAAYRANNYIGIYKAKSLNISSSTNAQLIIPTSGLSSQNFTFFSRFASMSVGGAGVGLRGNSGDILLWRNGGLFDVRLGGVDYTAAGTYNLGQVYNYALTSGASAVNVYVDGKSVISGGAAGNVTLANSNFGYDPVGGGEHNLNVEVGYIWNSALSVTKIASLSANPWQIFRPRKKVSYFDAPNVIATRTPSLTSSPADYSIDLTSGEAATITDYTKLGLRFRT